MKRSFLISAVLGLVAVLLYLFAVEPTEANLRTVRQELDDATSKHRLVQHNLGNAAETDRRLANCETNLAPYRAAMLKPLLESYSMRAKTLIDPLAAGAGLTDTNYEEQPVRALPLPKRTPKQLYARQPVRLTATGSYQGAVSFLARLEREFPLVALQSLVITGGNRPNQQKLDFILEWPVQGARTDVKPEAKKGGAK